MRSLLRVFLLLQLWWGPLAGQTPPPPVPQQWVTDGEGFLSQAVRTRLNQRLANYQRATGHQVLVYIAASTQGEPLENWTVKAFEAWKVGRKGMDDGLVLFILAKDRQVRLEVGYGLEGQLPDALASRIIRETILPRLKTGDRDGAVSAGTSELLRTLGGEKDAPKRGAAPGKAPLGLGSYLLIGLLALGFIALFLSNPALAIGLLFSLMSGGRGGGGGGRDDGFGGGGGRSGGGGASGSW